MQSFQSIEEEVFFPLLEQYNAYQPTLGKSIERLKFEHWEDESFAEDLSLQLRELVSNPEEVDIGKISYMLRGFFDGIRRHIAFEAEHLLPMIRH